MFWDSENILFKEESELTRAKKKLLLWKCVLESHENYLEFDLHTHH
jgi:hypothetical protein